MLIEFEVTNSRSIEKELTFSMIATEDKSLPQNLIKNPSYPQVFSAKYGFIPDLSLIDALFCMGKV